MLGGGLLPALFLPNNFTKDVPSVDFFKVRAKYLDQVVAQGVLGKEPKSVISTVVILRPEADPQTLINKGEYRLAEFHPMYLNLEGFLTSFGMTAEWIKICRLPSQTPSSAVCPIWHRPSRR